MTSSPFANPPSATPMLEQLLLYLSALPEARDIESLLRISLQAAIGLTGAVAGAATTTGDVQTFVAAGPERGLNWHAILGNFAQSSPTGDPPPAIEPQIWLDESDSYSLLFCALNSDGALHGLIVLRILDRRMRGGTEDSLLIAARAAGNALALLRGLIRTQHRLAELQLINEVAAVTGSTLDLNSLLEMVVRLTQTALRSMACVLMLIDEASNELVFEIPTGPGEEAMRQMRIPLDQGLAGWVARHGEGAMSNDVYTDDRFDSTVYAQNGFLVRNALAVPLQARGKVIGVLEVINKLGGKLYTDYDRTMLTLLAGQAAVALDNARLFTSLQTQHEKLLAAEEQVRKELARELHDGPAQQLAALVMGVDFVRKLIERDPERLPQELDALEQQAKNANRQIRTLQFQLRPVVLETRGLRAAIQYYVDQQSSGPVQLQFSAEGCTARLPEMVERSAFDIVQEALGNVRRHSGANNASVTMCEKPDRWEIEIRDDGQGFDVAAVLRAYELRGSLGMINMRERAQAIGGELNIESQPGQGTSVCLLIPASTVYA